jgi:hypothetical protein
LHLGAAAFPRTAHGLLNGIVAANAIAATAIAPALLAGALELPGACKKEEKL